jgi:hypothetical protein
MLEFRAQDRERVARGEITVTFRLWKRAKVRAGGRYAMRAGIIEVEEVTLIPAALISPDDVGPSGCDDIAAIRALAGEHTKTPVGPDTLLYRVQFRYVSPRASRPARRAAAPRSRRTPPRSR